jgi:CheY-like chemotaxis protein
VKTIRVLVAEDNDDHRYLTMHALSQFQGVRIQVEGVKDGEETLDFIYRRGAYADRSRPHLLILDLKMPKVGGLQVLEQLKSDPDTSVIPVVVLTSSDTASDIDEAYRYGTNSYMTKPTSTGGLREHLESLATYWGGYSELPSTR